MIISSFYLSAHSQDVHQAEVADSVMGDDYTTAIARALYDNNDFSKSLELYSQVPPETMTELDLTNYATTAYLSHRYEQALQVLQHAMGRFPMHIPFIRLAFFCHTELQHYDEAYQQADSLLAISDTAQLQYFDYLYLVRCITGRHTGAITTLWSQLDTTEQQRLKGSYQHLMDYYLHQQPKQSTARYYARQLLAVDPENKTARQLLDHK